MVPFSLHDTGIATRHRDLKRGSWALIACQPMSCIADPLFAFHFAFLVTAWSLSYFAAGPTCGSMRSLPDELLLQGIHARSRLAHGPIRRYGDVPLLGRKSLQGLHRIMATFLNCGPNSALFERVSYCGRVSKISTAGGQSWCLSSVQSGPFFIH